MIWQKIVSAWRHYTTKSREVLSTKYEGDFSALSVLFLLWGSTFTLLWNRMFYWSEEGIIAGWLGVWADWSVHLTYASVFAYTSPEFWLDSHPLYLGKKFTYPFLADAISGILIRFGFDIVSAFMIPTLITTFCFFLILFLFYRDQLRSSAQSLWAITLFITSGGIGFIWFLIDLWNNPSVATLIYPPREYTHIGQIHLEWLNTVSGQLLPQRALLLGFTVTLFIFWLLRKYIYSQMRPLKITVAAGILAFLSALLLFIHVHSFIVLVITCGVWFLISGKKYWKKWLLYALISGLLSFPFFWFLYGGEVGSGFFGWLPGWLANPRSKNENWFWFWFLNWGFFLPIALYGTWQNHLYKIPFVVSGWVLFILSNLILFQPYDWDNSKILLWSYLFLAIPVCRVLWNLWAGKTSVKIFFGTFLFLVLTLSGWLDIWRLLQYKQNSHLMWSYEELQLAHDFRALSHEDAIVLVSDKHNHWVSTLTGRQVLLGYRGWMWTYGIDYGSREADMMRMFAGEPGAVDLIHEYGIDFVVIGASEIVDFHANEAFFQALYGTPVLQSSQYRVYQVR